jgi:hypothetical protein
MTEVGLRLAFLPYFYVDIKVILLVKRYLRLFGLKEGSSMTVLKGLSRLTL